MASVESRLHSNQNIHDLSGESSLLIVDDILRIKAAEEEQVPVLAYPRSAKGLVDFELFTAKDLYQYTDVAVNSLVARGIKPIGDDDAQTVVAMLGPSNLEFIISMLAFSRLGYSVFILSPRLSTIAYVRLLESTDCRLICASPSSEHTVTKLQGEISVSQTRMLSREECQPSRDKPPSFKLEVDRIKCQHKVAYIMHSSGSTGLPKPIYQTHRGAIGNYILGHGFDTFLTVPLYHTHGHACLFRSIYRRCCTYFLNSNVPLTSANLIEVVENVKPAAINAVPYALKLLAETQRGVQAMQNCQLVSSAGSAMSDELGDRLVSNGIHVVSLWGSTETGAIMNSMRPFEDKDWSYMSIVPSAASHIWMKPLGDTTYEMVALDGLQSKVISNSDDPPHSFHTRDMFAPHPTKTGRWKYLGRLDDRVTLSNGEKVLPLSMEGRLREESLVREAVIFGTDRPLPGLLLFRSEHAAHMDDETFLDRIMPAVDEANLQVESFAQVIRATIVPLGAEVNYPRTDKSTFIRAQVYKAFEKEIDDAYHRLDNSQEGSLKLNRTELETFIMHNFRNECSIDLDDIRADFFAAGADSLQAIKFSRFLKQELFLGGNASKVDQSTIFEMANTSRLAEYLFQLQSDTELDEKDKHIDLMSEMIQKYSFFEQPKLSNGMETRAKSVVLTGATGSLGAHLLSQLLSQEDGYEKVYCLVRASSVAQARERVLTSLANGGLAKPSDIVEERLICLPSDFSKENLGLQSETLAEIKRSVSLIIHCAWSVNFNWSLMSFEQHNIKGTYNLLNLALSSNVLQKVRFIFCSSISVAARASRTDTVPEKLLTDLYLAGNMGYAQSKMVAEHVVHHAASSTDIDVRVVRIGQIVGSQELGWWNDSELIPLIVRSSLVLGCLPELEETCSWLPVDSVARAVLDIANREEPAPQAMNGKVTSSSFYNILNPRRFSWTDDFLPSLSQAGLEFAAVPTETWLQALEHSDPDPLHNPTIKLLPLLLNRYAKTRTPNEEPLSDKEGDPIFATDDAQRASAAIKAAPNVVEQQNVERFVKNWLKKWNTE